MSRLQDLRDALAARAAVRSSEAVFVGYPKTGNTWTRFLVGTYVATLRGLPEVPLFDERPRLRRSRAPHPTYHFTHHPLTWRGQTAADLREGNVTRPFRHVPVVLLARHPLDALVSSWHHAAGRTPALFTGDLIAFVDDPVWGFDKLARFYRLWSGVLQRSDVDVLRYEDLVADPASRLLRLASFLELPVDQAAADHAASRTSFDAMRDLERSDPDRRYRGGGPVFSPGAASGEAPHVRRGAVGGWRDEIPEHAHERLATRVAQEMPAQLGYGVAID